MAVKDIALVRAASQSPIDLQAAALNAAQQQELARALLAKSLEDAPPVFHTAPGNQFGTDIPNFMSPISKIANAYYGNKQMREANEAANMVALETNRRRRGELDSISNALFGKMVEGERPSEEYGGGPGIGQQIPPDYREAVRIAQSSNDPAIQGTGLKLMEGVPTPKDLLKEADKLDPSSLRALQGSQNIADVAPAAKSTIADGVAVKTQGGNVVGTTAVNKYRQETGSSGQPLSVNVDTGEAKGLGSFGNQTPEADLTKGINTDMVKTLTEGRKGYVDNAERLVKIGQIRSDLATTPEDKFGSFAPFRNEINKFTELLGAQKKGDTAQVEKLQANLSSMVLDKIRLLAPVTEQDIAFVQQVVGTVGMTKRGLEMIMDRLEQATTRDMSRHENMIKDFPVPPQISRESFNKHYIPYFSSTAAPIPSPMDRSEARRRLGL